MKKELREVDINLHATELSIDACGGHREMKLEARVYGDMIGKGIKTFIEVDIPETLKEFRGMHSLSKQDLVKWLNENYKITY